MTTRPSSTTGWLISDPEAEAGAIEILPPTLHMLYATSKALFVRFTDELLRLFTAFNTRLGVCSFPIHAEFRLQGGELVPIEFNPLRLGGMGLAHLCYHTLGVNGRTLISRSPARCERSGPQYRLSATMLVVHIAEAFVQQEAQ